MRGGRPYDYRRDGAVGRVRPLQFAGGIFGQPNRPRNHLGIFEVQYALPDYIEKAELDGGTLFSDTLQADSTQAEPIEKNITAPDLGPPVTALYPTFKRQARQKARARRRFRAPSPVTALSGDETVTTTVKETVSPTTSYTPAPPPAIVTKPGLLQRPVAGPLVLIGVGVFLAYAIFGGE